MFDRQKLVIGLSSLVLLLGFLLLGFTEGGVFNRVVPTDYRLSVTVYHPEGAYIDLSRGGPVIGLVLIGLGGVGVTLGYARKEIAK